MKGIWKFKNREKSDKMVDPIQSQFFTTNIVGGLTAALVRETIQNSLDAKIEEDNESEDVSYPAHINYNLHSGFLVEIGSKVSLKIASFCRCRDKLIIH
jgi:hypothetical protein